MPVGHTTFEILLRGNIVASQNGMGSICRVTAGLPGCIAGITRDAAIFMGTPASQMILVFGAMKETVLLVSQMPSGSLPYVPVMSCGHL